MPRTEELIELCKVAARYKGKYISTCAAKGMNGSRPLKS